MTLNHSIARSLGLAAVLVASSAAMASTETAPSLSFDLKVGSTSASWSDNFGGAVADSKFFSYAGSKNTSKGSFEYSIMADPDPVLGFDFSFWNTSDETQVFSVLVTLPVVPWANATTMGASIGGSVTDANGDGIGTLSSVGTDSVFTGWIDGALWMPLLKAISVDVPFTGGTSIISDVDGLPGPSKPGPFGVANTMSIALEFQLTPGDRASFTGVFIVEYIPAPSALVVLAGGMVIGRRRRN